MSTNGQSPFTGSLRHQLLLGLALVVLGSLYAVRLNEVPIGAVTDDAYYVEMARSIAEGLGPVINTGPDVAPHDPDIFPPGFPLLLSPLARAWPDSLSALKAVPLLGALMLLPLCWWLPGAKAARGLRLALVAVVMFNPWVVSWSGRILSDIPFAALSLAALLLFVRLHDRLCGPDQPAVPWVGVVGLVLLCAAAVSVRTIGWAAVLAMSATLLTRRRWWVAIALPVLVAALVWLISQAMPNGGELLSQGYSSQMFSHGNQPYWRFVLHNALQYVAELPVILVPVFGNPVKALMLRLHMEMLYPAAAFIVGTQLLFLVGLAVGRLWRRETGGVRVRLFVFYLLIYGAVLTQFNGYPSGVQTRLLIPVLPILVWFVLAGLHERFDPGHRLIPQLVLGLMLIAAFGHNGWRVARPLRTAVEANGRGLVDPETGSAWLRTHTQPDNVIMAQEPLVRHIHFQRPVVATPHALSAESVARMVQEFAVSYVLVGPVVHHQPHRLDAKGQALLDILQSQPALYQAVHADPVANIHIFSCASD
ncbi:MAG: hypothetical protein QNL91_01085 [Candidatus Krumholzibacteria bacterium]|nr:hypothetical protein [Candidatus Krumholzibacteria bacterium]